MSTSQTTDKTIARPIKVHKRLRDSGAEVSHFLHTFPKQAKTVFPPQLPPTDTLRKDQQTGSPNRHSSSQDSTQLSGTPVSSALDQTTHETQYPASGQTVGTEPVSSFYHAQSGSDAPMLGTVPGSVFTTGQVTNPAYSPISPLHNPRGDNTMSAPRNTESDFAGFHAVNTYGSMPQTHSQGQPPLYSCQWAQESFTPYHNTGAMEHGQFMGGQQGVAVIDQSSASHLQHTQQSFYYHTDPQHPSVYANPGSYYVNSSAQAVGSRYPPQSNSPGSGSDSTTN